MRSEVTSPVRVAVCPLRDMREARFNNEIVRAYFAP